VRHVLEPRGLALADARTNFNAALTRSGREAVAVG
jgi:hypothetical protein